MHTFESINPASVREQTGISRKLQTRKLFLFDKMNCAKSNWGNYKYHIEYFKSSKASILKNILKKYNISI